MQNIEQSAQQIADLLSTRPSGILTDIDGTISKVAVTPEAAIVEPGAREVMERLTGLVDIVAAITGRAASDGYHMIGLESVVCFGNHGMERRIGEETVVAEDAVEFVPVIRDVLEATRDEFEAAGYLLENKGATASIHYRGATDPDQAKEHILSVVGPLAGEKGVRLSSGRMVVELRPPVNRNKGTALRDLVEAYHLRSAIFLGDDVTDLDAMKALHSLRESGHIAGITVGATTPESPAAIAETADVIVDGVDGVVELLTQVADRLSAKRA